STAITCRLSAFPPRRSSDLHLLCGHDRLVRAMTAAFRPHLILDMHARRTRPDKRAHGTSDVECRGPETGVGIDKKGQIADLGDKSEEHTSELQSREKLVCRL